MAKHARERQIIHRACTAAVSPDASPPVGQWKNVDWEWIIDAARFHSVESHVYDFLAQIDHAHVPEAVRAFMVRRRRGIVLRNLQLARELVRGVNALETASIPVIPIKGPLLGQLAYEDLAVRQALDLDLLVREEHFWHAKQLLHQMGYQSLRSLTVPEQREFVEWHASYELIHPGQNIVVELHHDLLPANASDHVSAEQAWARHTHIPLMGVDMRSLDLNDLVIYLCAHGTRHEWTKLKWLCDVAGLVHRQPDIAWPVVCRRAETTGSMRSLTLAFWLIKQHFDMKAPQTVHAHMHKDALLPTLGAVVLNHEIHSHSEPSKSSWQTFWFHFRSRERWRDRIPYLMHILRLVFAPSQQDHGFLSLPKPLSWLYCLVRPVRVLRDLITLKPHTSRDG